MQFNLNPIITKNKPGSLVNLNIDDISNKLGINFKYNKIFYINDLNSLKSRGNHSNSNAREILVCLNGSFDIKLFDGENETLYKITKNKGIYIEEDLWIDFFNFKDCTILVFVEIFPIISKESIYDIDEFKKYKKNKNNN